MKKDFLATLSLICLFFLFSCIKENAASLPQDKAMRLTLEAYYTDTSLFHSVKLDEAVVANEAAIVAGTLNKLFQSPAGGLFLKDSAKITATVVKKNNPNLAFDSTVYLTNINEFLLLQLDPRKKPVFINKRLENATAIKPGKDSVKVRFYFGSEEDFRSRIPGNNKATILRLKLYIAERQPDGSYQKNNTVVATINNIRANELTPYYSFYVPDNKEYLFDVLDGRSGNFTDAQRLIQRYDFDPDFFIDSYVGRIEKQPAIQGLFQTCRITRSSNLNGVRAVNAPFLFGLD
jgi:hypothetical protein